MAASKQGVTPRVLQEQEVIITAFKQLQGAPQLRVVARLRAARRRVHLVVGQLGLSECRQIQGFRNRQSRQLSRTS